MLPFPTPLYTCELCLQQFTTKADRRRHSTPYIACPEFGCDTKYRKDKWKDMKTHIEKAHRALSVEQSQVYFKALCPALQPVTNLCPRNRRGSSRVPKAASTTNTNPSSSNSPNVHSPGNTLIVPPSQTGGLNMVDPASLQRPNPTSAFTNQDSQILLGVCDNTLQEYIIGHNTVLSSYINFALQNFELWLAYLNDHNTVDYSSIDHLTNVRDHAQQSFVLLNRPMTLVFTGFAHKYSDLWWEYVNRSTLPLVGSDYQTTPPEGDDTGFP
ncbi:MAG: hypothetical protein M1834_004767 [Cirrosporium novae-zelandiae]|nr:MAG: hypothetical protein M1834_004767 [Cirrosporium novae-zelandiae]